MEAGFGFEGEHEGAGDALAAGFGVDQELGDVSAVGLVGWGVEEKLDGTYNLVVLRGYEEDAFGVRQDLGLPPARGVFESEGEDEAYARSVVDIGIDVLPVNSTS